MIYHDMIAYTVSFLQIREKYDEMMKEMNTHLMQRQHLNKDLKRLQVTFSSLSLSSGSGSLYIYIFFFCWRGKFMPKDFLPPRHLGKFVYLDPMALGTFTVYCGCFISSVYTWVALQLLSHEGVNCLSNLIYLLNPLNFQGKFFFL